MRPEAEAERKQSAHEVTWTGSSGGPNTCSDSNSGKITIFVRRIMCVYVWGGEGVGKGGRRCGEGCGDVERCVSAFFSLIQQQLSPKALCLRLVRIAVLQL